MLILLPTSRNTWVKCRKNCKNRWFLGSFAHYNDCKDTNLTAIQAESEIKFQTSWEKHNKHTLSYSIDSIPKCRGPKPLWLSAFASGANANLEQLASSLH